MNIIEIQNKIISEKIKLKNKSKDYLSNFKNIEKYIKKKSNGFYVDIGAHHPIQRNNTHLLFLRGWEGINIDINNFSIDLFNFLRPNLTVW